MASYEELIAKSKELAASGQTDEAKRVAQIALKMRPNRTQEATPSGDGPLRQFGSGAAEGVTGMLGLVSDIPQAIGNAALSGVDALAGTDLRGAKQEFQEAAGPPMGSSRGYQGALRDVGVIGEDPQTAGQGFARGLGREFGAAAIPGAMAARTAGVAPVVISEGAAALGGEALATAARETGNEKYENIARLLGNLGAGVPTAIATSTAKPKVPTADEIVKSAGQRIDDAVSSGQTVDPQITAALSKRVRTTLADEGLIRPSGKIQKRYERVRDVMDLMDDYGNNPMTPVQAQNARRQVLEAASRGGSEGRIGAKIASEFDDTITDQYIPGLKEASARYGQGKRGQDVDLLIERAGRQANRSGTGGNTVNAIRQRADALLRRIEDGKALGYSDEQVEALRRIVNGDTLTNTLRAGGFLAPSTGKLQAALAATGGMLSTGNPMQPLYLGAVGVSEASKAIAEALTKRQVNALSESVRGVSRSPRQITDATKAIIAALTASQAPQLQGPQ